MSDDYVRIGSPPGNAQLARKRRWPWAAGIAAVIAIAAGIAASVYLVRDDSMRITGTIRVVGSAGKQWNRSTGNSCTGAGGYSDIGAGARVVVADASGTTVATGELGVGEPDGRSCVFPFAIDGVPAGHDFYGIEVTHRGVVKFSKADVASKPVELSLGG